jgi:asparagine synthase (glutamine-hydrolysing)
MCGIAGQFDFGGGAPIDRDRLLRMTRVLTHRGPDDEGTYISVSGSLGLGFRRLAILDLSPAGHQPMSDPEGKVWVVFNGEIYNFREVRRELEALGHVFRSQTDTEVIVLGYVQWGDAVLRKLNGMFGLAIWDEPKRRLIVARDAMGIKPVYYSVDKGTVTFGSEIRAVLAGLERRPNVDPLAVSLFLQYRYTPAPLTAFAGVRKLAPGEMLIVEQGELQARRWYEFIPTPFERQPSDEEAAHTLLELYRGAVKRHLISDVPVGLLLSGGIDSGLLLGLMSECGKDWPTYTVGYGSSFRDDELDDAAETARHYGASNTAVHLDRKTFEDALPRIIETMEEPIASSSIVPMYFVCQRARQDVTVALIGQGPDELLGGYIRHLGVAYGAAWRQLPPALRRFLAAVANALPRSDSLKRGVSALGTEDRLRRYQHVFSIVPGRTIASLFRPGVLPAVAGDAVLESWNVHRAAINGLDELGGLQLLELRSSLPDELLMYGDKISMAHSLEARVPFLDREVVEYIQRLGPRFKVRNGRRKWLHRKVCRKFLPASIIRRKKRGFGVNVVDDWFRGSVSGKMRDYLLGREALIFDYLNPEAVEQLYSQHVSGRRDNHKILFSLVVFEQWLRAFCVHPQAVPHESRATVPL